MTNEHTTAAAYGALLLRVSLGTMYLTHGVVLKWMTFGLDGTAKFFESIGFPVRSPTRRSSPSLSVV